VRLTDSQLTQKEIYITLHYNRRQGDPYTKRAKAEKLVILTSY